MSDKPDIDSLRPIADAVGVNAARRHILLCCDQTKPKCVGKKRSLESWHRKNG